jgi:D-serine deaminase-like pyridoxal phosphate-dependent protein
VIPPLLRSSDEPWRTPSSWWPRFAAPTAHLETPLAAVSLEAFAHNAFDMAERAAGTTIRVASKSVRIRSLIDAALTLDGYAGVLAYTLPEALWLAETIDDVVVGYPSVDVTAIRELASNPELASRVTLMVDSLDHLDFIDEVAPPGTRESLRLCLEIDMSFVTRALGHVGVWRSPVHEAVQARRIAEAIARRRGFTLVGIMGYEAQIAGVGNRPKGNPARAVVLDLMQSRSVAELTERRGDIVEAVGRISPLEFVNGGGTGSLESTSADASVTEIAAGSGLLGGHLFDTYSRFRPAPAAAFALSVVRKPTPRMATLLGGGWIASGPPQKDRTPEIVWPEGLELQAREMAGEVQSPVSGRSAVDLRIGDRAWLRHTKSGELAEHVSEVAIVSGDEIVAQVPSYRGEGKSFL